MKQYAMIRFNTGDVKIYQTKEEMTEKEFIKRIRAAWQTRVTNILVIEEREPLSSGK